MLNEIMDQNNITTYALAKKTGIPYSTLSDIVSGKTDIQDVSATVLYKLSQGLGVSMESLYLGKSDRNTYYLSNAGRNVTLYAGRMEFTYQGPKNLVGFRNIRSMKNNVLYIDTYFRDENGRIYVEEDYIDLMDVMTGHEELLTYPYDIILGIPGESKTSYLIDNSLMVSDGMAITLSDNGTKDTILEVVNLKRNKEKLMLRLNDYALLYSNMSKNMEKRAIESVRRNHALIAEEAAERKHA